MGFFPNWKCFLRGRHVRHAHTTPRNNGGRMERTNAIGGHNDGKVPILEAGLITADHCTLRSPPFLAGRETKSLLEITRNGRLRCFSRSQQFGTGREDAEVVAVALLLMRVLGVDGVLIVYRPRVLPRSVRDTIRLTPSAEDAVAVLITSRRADAVLAVTLMPR